MPQSVVEDGAADVAPKAETLLAEIGDSLGRIGELLQR